MQAVFRTYYGSDTTYTTTTNFNTDYNQRDSLSGDGLAYFDDLIMDGFVNGPSTIATGSLAYVVRLVPYIDNTNGLADLQAYDAHRANQESNSADTTINDAFEEFFDASTVTNEFGGLLLFQKISKAVNANASNVTALSGVVSSYLDAIKAFGSGSLNADGCNGINRLVFEMVGSTDATNSAAPGVDAAKLADLKGVLDLVAAFAGTSNAADKPI